MAKVKLVLKSKKVIRGKEVSAGTVLAIGETMKTIEASDIDKAMQLGEVTCVVETPAKVEGEKDGKK